MDHYIAYHSVELMGHEYEPTEQFHFFSRKPQSVLRRALGNRVWVVVGRRDGSATTFSLAGVFTPSEVRAESDGFGIVGPGTPVRPSIDVTARPWFQALLQEQRNFSFGLNRIRSKEIVAELERHFETPESNAAVIHDICVYAIRHGEALEENWRQGDQFSFTERRSWARAAKELALAKQSRVVLPIVFADARATKRLIFRGQIDDIRLLSTGGKSRTTVVASHLEKLARLPLKTQLTIADTGRRIPAGHIRSYVICRTPPWFFSEEIVSPASPPDRKQDRRNPVRAAELFQRLCPNPSVRSMCEDRLAQSICFAHRCAPASWEVTMFDDRLRLNVGQVEVLTLSASELRFIFSASTAMTTNRLLSVEFDPENPVYPAVPRPSGVCRLNLAHIQTVPNPFWDAHEAYIAAAADIKKVSPFKKSFSPAVIEYMEKSLGQQLPRQEYWMAGTPHRERPVASPPEEILSGSAFLEGSVTRIAVNRYERDPHAREACITHYGARCFACGFDFGAIYGQVVDGFIHVHHLKALSAIGAQYEVDSIRDLRPVCPNCHAVIHRREPPYSIEEMITLLQQNSRSEVPNKAIQPTRDKAARG